MSEQWIYNGRQSHWQKQSQMSERPVDWKNHMCKYESARINDCELRILQRMRGTEHRWLEEGYWSSSFSHGN